jgi:hypothetical protein
VYASLRRLDPATWPAAAVFTVLGGCAVAFLVSTLVDNVWIFRALLFGGYITAIAVLLRASWFRAREILLVLGPALVGLVIFRYFVPGIAGDIGQAVCAVVPLLIGLGFIDRSVVLGTLAPGRYDGYSNADQKMVWAFREGFFEIGRAIDSGNDKAFTKHVNKALILGNVSTDDPEWLDVRRKFLAYGSYVAGGEGDRSEATADKLMNEFVETSLAVRKAKRIWFGRLGRPTRSSKGRA